MSFRNDDDAALARAQALEVQVEHERARATEATCELVEVERELAVGANAR